MFAKTGGSPSQSRLVLLSVDWSSATEGLEERLYGRNSARELCGRAEVAGSSPTMAMLFRTEADLELKAEL